MGAGLDSEAKRRLLEIRLSGRSEGRITRSPEISPRPAGSLVPLSPHQRSMWALDRVLPDGSLYNTHQGLRLRGPLDTAAVRTCLEATVRRHESLRTTFPGPPTAGQVVHAEHAPDFAVVDLPDTGDSPTERWEAACLLATEEAGRSFDLAAGPLFRARIYRLAEDDHLLLLVVHHIVNDGWSFDVILRELATGYPVAGHGTAAVQTALDESLGSLPVQYGDFTTWLSRREEDGTAATELRARCEELAGVPVSLELPTDRLRPAMPSYRGGVAVRTLPSAVGDAARAYAREHGTSLFTVLLSAYKVLLHRYSGQKSFHVGTVVAGRTGPRTQHLVGLFANTIVLPTRIAPDDTYVDLAQREHRRLLAALEHQQVAFNDLVDALKPPRDVARNPLFQAFFLHRDADHAQWRLPGLTVEPLEFDTGLTKFDLSLCTADDGTAIRLQLAYMTDLIDAATAERMVRHYEQLLTQLLAAPAAPIADADPLTEDERRALRAAGSGAEVPREPETLVRLLEQTARRHPDRVAVSLAGAELTYAELHRRADALAARLRVLGAGPDRPVGVCLERSPELLVAVLGVLKAGSAYLPLDPGYPAARLDYMLADAGAGLLIGSPRTPVELPEFRGSRVFVDPADGEDPVRDTPDGTDVSAVPPVDPANLAYVIYTSGSTGRPKGVQVPHAGIVNRLLWMQEEYGLSEADRVLQKTPISFDVSVWELFWPLMVGARLVLAAPGGHLNPRYLARLVKDEQITVCHFVPSMLGTFLADPSARGCDSLRLVVCSGEALAPGLARQAGSAFPAARLENLYGPTEASVDVTSWDCGLGPRNGSVPIGRAITNTRALVLDDRLCPVPPGVIGELFLGGAGLARGYRGRPGLTAERFVPDPWSSLPGERLYRTGDLARMHPDGVIEYCGRTDSQVKVNGVRVELGEIETRLRELPEVGDAVVVLRDDEKGRGRLVAHVVLTASDPAAPERLRRSLAEYLPQPMVPNTLVRHDELPRSPAGKADRLALANWPLEPATADRRERPEYASPLEAELAGIWSRVLGVPSVAPGDNFFELGGDSLLAISCCGQMAAAGHEVEPLQFLRLQTLRHVAQHVEQRGE
ncbi:amino acid adenylation domain-containing protein [Streptomyces sp. NPDC059534]|uniref:non-ribosomal peptide synthetase n=1 Tax=Streptomyces sp. NPDC059534 TaxID=3346859 RepID=UPI0036B75C13